MTREEYIVELGKALAFMKPEEREDVVREFESHLADAAEARPELSEEELLARLPPPASIGAIDRKSVV